MIRDILPKILLVPTFLLVLLFVLVRIFDALVPSLVVGAALGLSLLAFAGSIAMIFAQPDVREWRFVAMLNANPYVLFLLAALLIRT